MLLTTLQLLTAISAAGLGGTVKAEAAANAREAGRTAGIFSIAGVLVLLGAIFVSASAMLGLATVWPAHWAALAVGGVLILGGGAVLYSACQKRGHRQERQPSSAPQPAAAPASAPSPAPPPAAAPPPDLAAAMRPVEDWVRRHPGAATAAAIGLGMLACFLSDCETRPDEAERDGGETDRGRPHG